MELQSTWKQLDFHANRLINPAMKVLNSFWATKSLDSHFKT